MSVRKREWQTSKGEFKQAWVVDYRDGQGKRRNKNFEKKKDADAFELKAKGEIKDGTHVADSESITVKEAAEIWHRAVKVGRDGRDPAEASTLRQYRTHIDLHIVPRIGAEKLSNLTRPMMRKFRGQLLEHMSRAMARKVLASIKSILSEAVSQGLMGVNVASELKILTSDRHKTPVEIPERAEIALVLKKLDELATQPIEYRARAWRRWRAFMVTAIHTGCRMSELRGLRWVDINLHAGTINITQRADEDLQIGSVKSGSARRTIDIPSILVSVLKSWKLECPPGELAFPNSKGNVEGGGNIHNRCWQPLQCKAGLIVRVTDSKGRQVVDEKGRPKLETKYTFHALRHFHASMLIASKANPKDVQVEMGHSSIQVTYDLYGHLFSDEDAIAQRKARAEQMAGSLS